MTNYEWTATTCSKCGKPTKLPFKPDGKRPVYCRECYSVLKPKSVNPKTLRFDGFNFRAGEKGVWKFPRNERAKNPFHREEGF